MEREVGVVRGARKRGWEEGLGRGVGKRGWGGEGGVAGSVA